MQAIENGMAIAITAIVQAAAIVETAKTMTITVRDRNAGTIMTTEKASATAAIAGTQATCASRITAANALTSATAI